MNISTLVELGALPSKSDKRSMLTWIKRRMAGRIPSRSIHPTLPPLWPRPPNLHNHQHGLVLWRNHHHNHNIRRAIRYLPTRIRRDHPRQCFWSKNYLPRIRMHGHYLHHYSTTKCACCATGMVYAFCVGWTDAECRAVY